MNHVDLSTIKLESGSASDAVMPSPVHHAITGARCLYGKGTYVASFDETYSLALRIVT